MARSTASTRFNGQPSDSAVSTLPSIARCSRDDAGEDVAEEGGLGRLEGDALDLAADPEAPRTRPARRPRPCRRPPSGRAPARRRGAPRCARRSSPSVSLSREPALDAQHGERRLRRAAALVQFGDAGAGPGLRLGLDGEDAVAERQAARDREVHQRARALAGDDLVVARLAADDAAERHRGVVGRSGRFRRIEGDGDGGGISSAPGTVSTIGVAPAPPRSPPWRRAGARRRCRRSSAPRRRARARLGAGVAIGRRLLRRGQPWDSCAAGDGPVLARARGLGKPRGVAGHEIDLEVEAVARPALAPGRHGERVRDDAARRRRRLRPSFTVSEVPSRATEPFSAMKRGERARRADVEAGASAPRVLARRHLLARDDLGDAVHMAGDDVAAELVADLERALEIDPRARRPVADGGARQRLGRGVDVERSSRRRAARRRPRSGKGRRRRSRRRARSSPDRRTTRSGCGAAAARRRDIAATRPISVTMPVNISRPSRRMSSRSGPSVLGRDAGRKRSRSAPPELRARAPETRARRARVRARRERELVDEIGARRARPPRRGPPSQNTRVMPRDAEQPQRLARGRAARPGRRRRACTSTPAAASAPLGLDRRIVGRRRSRSGTSRAAARPA